MEQLNLKLKLNANGSIKASWSKITGATRYQAYMSPVGASYVLYNEKNLTTTSYTSEANLEANKQYQVTVIAYGKSSTITSDGKKILIPLGYYNNTPLSVPTNVKATADAVSVTVKFDAASRATGYDILFDDKVYSVTGTSKKFTGLKPKTSHTYAVRAKNARLKSEYSATKTIKTLAQLPAVPSNIKKTATGTTAKISWGKVSKATSYELRFNGNGYNLTTTSKKFTGLTPGKSYTFKIRSKNADGASAYTDVKTVKTAPKPPTTVTATSTINSVTINWSKVTAASGYTVEFNGTKYRCGNSIISRTFTGLTPKTAYTYRVCSESADGSGTYSTKKTITTLPQLPAAPSNSTKASTENSVTISWSPVSGATGYDVLINGMVYSVAGTSCTINGLSPNTSYTYQILSKNADGASAYGAAKTVKTTPLPPSAPDATPTKDSVAISWTTVTGATGYDVLFNGVKYTVSVAYIRIPNLTPGTTYTYSIRVNNGDGSSSYCPTRTVTTIPNPPAAPANVRATATENAITISWDAASTATSYAVCFEGSERLTSGTSLTIKGLSPGTKYSYKVRAKNAGGYGPYSAESVMQTIQVVPDVPKNVKLTAKTDYIIIEWSKVFDADSYDVRVGGKVYRLTGTALRVEDLVPNTEYSLQVRANNEAGSSEYTEAQTVWTLLETPTDVWAKTTMNSVIVSWYPVEGATNYDVQFDGVPYNVTKSETITQIGENEPVEVRLDTYDSMNGTNIAMLTNTDEEEIDKHMYKFFIGLETGSKHTYCVRANNAHSSSSYSKLKEVTTDYEWESRLPLGKKRRTYPDGRMAHTGIDPVNALTGAFLWSYTWLEDFGKDKLHFTTMYDSRREGNSKILGNKWTHSLNYMLTMDEKAAYFTTPNGDVITFDRNTTNDTFRVKNGRYSGYTMEKTVNGGYGVKTSDGTEYIFASNLCLDQMAENGQVIYQFASNEAGQIVEIEGRHGRCLYLTYENGHIVQATDMKGSTVKFSYKGDRLASVINPGGNEMSFTYDNRDNLLTISDFTGERYLTNTYDVLDRVTQQSVRGRGGCEASYDEENRVTTFEDEMKNVTKYYYDEAGNVTTVEMEGTKIQNSYNENGQLTKQVDALGNVTEMAYDECGRMNCVTHPDGTKEQAFYNDQNQPVRVINRDGTECLYEYDENNNLTAVQDERGNSCFYTYDSNNNLISYTDKNGNLWTYSYDGNGHLKQAKDPEGNIYHYSHDAVGRLISYTSPEGKTTSYHYSEAGDLLRMEEPDGAICYEYDRNGNCTGIVNKMGDMQRREYDNIGKLSLATDFMGNEYSFSYDKKGNLTKETDPLGYSASYAYDAFGNCIEWIDKNRNITQYSFDAANQLTEVKDAQGAVTRYVYDTMGQVKTIINPLKHQTEYTYDNAGRLLSETDALGNSICYTYDEVGNLLTKTDQEGAVTAYSYDKENRLCSIQSDAGTVKFTYDKLGRVIAVEDANGHAETAEYDGDGNLTVASDKENYRTAYTYDQSGRMIKVIVPNGGETSYEYDSNGNCTKVTDAEGNSYTYVYNANNQVIHVTDPLGHDTFYEYDAVGQLISVTDAKGAKTTFEYDGNGNLYKEINPLGGEKTYKYDCHKRLREVTDEEGYLSSFLYDAAGNMTSYLDANKKRWTYTYDAANRLTAVTDRNGDSLTYAYTKTGKIAKVTDPEGAETSYQYDAMGRLVKMSDALEHSLSFTYDKMGRVLSQTDANGNITKYEYSPTGNLIGVTDAEGNTTAYTYNALGQMLTATDALGNITSYTYNALGQVASITDAMGAETTFTYTANGQIATVTDANGGITEYNYDACGNLIQTKDPLGNIVSYEYDAMNNRIKECLSAFEEQTCITLYQYDKRGCMIREINPLSEEKTYTYDGNGNYVAFTDEDGSETKVTYDLNNRPIQMNYSDGRAATFRYNKRGELVEMKDWNGTVSMERDRLGRLTKVTDPNGYVTGYSYDAMGNKTGIFYPDGSSVNYAYDKNNRLAAVTDTEGKTTKYGYDPVGNIVSVTRPGGIATYAYNANRRPVKASYQLNDGTSMEESFTYDVLGHLSGSVRKGSSADFARSTAYTYDALGRLVTCQENQDTESYIYDALGNRVRKLLNGVEQSNCQYNAMNQLIAMTQNGIPYSYRYDKRGNLTEESRNGNPIRQYTYDTTNHLTSGKNLESGEQTEYGYNALYMRVKNVQTLAGNEAFRIKETTYVADYLSRPNNDLMSFEKGGVTTRTSYGRGYELLGQKVMPGAESTTPAQMMHFQSDILGSPLLAVGEQGELLHYAERSIWGNLKAGVHGNSDLAGFEDSFRFTSYGYDSVIGKHFAYARFYDSSQGRMLAKDPIKRGLNPYLYCDNDPVDYVDSTGEIPTMLIGGLLGGVTGGVFGFAGSAVSQLVSGEEFSWKKALGSAANGAVVGAVQGSLVGSGVGIPAAFAANFGAGAVGNVLEQKISTGSVNVRESITSGLTNAVSGAIYGNAPLKSFKSAFFRGSAAGGATAAINNISNAIGSMYTDDEESFGYSNGMSANWATSNGRRRNPRTLCGGINPFEKSLGYQTAYGYQYSAGQSSSSTRITRKKKGFSLGEFAKDVAVGTMTGGLASVAFHGLGKAVEALTGSVGRSTNVSKSSKETVNQIQDPYALMRERGIPQTLTDVEIDAANQFNLQMRANEGSTRATNIPLTFEQALDKLEQSGLKPGQTVISRSKVIKIAESYDPIKASSSVYTDATGRYLVEGHHTTVATTMLGRGSGLNMNTPTQQLPSATNIHWTKKWYEFWKKTIKVLE